MHQMTNRFHFIMRSEKQTKFCRERVAAKYLDRNEKEAKDPKMLTTRVAVIVFEAL